MFAHWLRSMLPCRSSSWRLFADGFRRHSAARLADYRPRLEPLENRTVPSTTATHFFLTVPETGTVGKPLEVGVIALDASDHWVQDFTGTVTLTSTGAGDMLPGPFTFDHGFHEFTMTPGSTGPDTITATDSADSITGDVTPTVLAAPVATHFFVIVPRTNGEGDEDEQGDQIPVTVIALDQSDHWVKDYTGTAALTSSVSSDTLPGPAMFENGMHVFMMTPGGGGADTVTATDTKNSSITGSAIFNVTGAATHFFVIVPRTAEMGESTPVTVIALDASDHWVHHFSGTVTLTSTGSGDMLPGPFTFNHGIHTFQMTPGSAGTTDTVTATDSADNLTGQAAFNVINPEVATHFFVVAPPTVPVGVLTPVFVIALDAADHWVRDFTGTVTLTTTNANDTVPGPFTFDGGFHKFMVTFAATGNDTVTATDSAHMISGTDVVAVGTSAGNQNQQGDDNEQGDNQNRQGHDS